MFGTFLTLLIVLLLIASFMRGDFALTLIYLVVGDSQPGFGGRPGRWPRWGPNAASSLMPFSAKRSR